MVDYWFDTTYGCGLVTVDKQKIIVKTCPIFNWMTGNGYDYIVNYLISKRQFKGVKKLDTYLSESERIENEENIVNDVSLLEFGKIRIKEEGD